MLFWCVVFPVALYIYIRLSRGITRSSTCLMDKTALVTGANSGIGYQTALVLAARGCKVIMADVANMEQSKRNIIKYTNNFNITTKNLDLSSLKTVRDFASDIIKTEERLDVLINNAGIAMSMENRTEDGLHKLMQINYFGHFLLTHLLTDLLKKSAPSRIVFTSSSTAFANTLTLENLNFKPKFDTPFEKFRSYCNSKFTLLIASDIFAEKLKGTGVTSNCVHPGIVATATAIELSNTLPVINNTIINFFIRFYMRIYAKDAWEGSQVLVHVAVSKKLEQVSGKYFFECTPFVKPRAAYNKEFCRSIWEATEKYVDLQPEEKL